MFLPGSFIASLLVLVLGMLALGAWPSFFKSVGRKWRFELWYCDFAVGFVIASLIAAFTLGSMGQDGFSFIDDFLLAGKRQDAFALVAGAAFNLGNMLFVGAISIAGMTAAAPMALGVAIVVAAITGPLVNQPANLLLNLGGSLVMLFAVVTGAIIYRRWALARLVEAMQTGKTKSTRKIISSKPVLLSVVAGLLIGISIPMMTLGADSEIRLGPYSYCFVFGLGILFSTLGYNLFFMNLPVQGKAVEMGEYFRAKISAHFAGILGGAVALAGFLCRMVAARADGAAHLSQQISFGLGHASPFITMLLGLIYWREYESGDSNVNSWVVITIVVFLAALALLTFGQLPPVVAK